MTMRERFRPARGLAQAALLAGMVWALIPAEDAPTLLHVGLVATLLALAVAALAASATETRR